MGTQKSFDKYMRDQPVHIFQDTENPMRYHWYHTPGHEDCEFIIDWFARHRLEPFQLAGRENGQTMWATYDFKDRPDLGILFKLSFG